MTDDDRGLGARLISPHNFDGTGDVPEEVRNAAKRIARLRTRFLISDDPLGHGEVEELFTCAALQAEWMRELFEARDNDTPRPSTESVAAVRALHPCKTVAEGDYALTPPGDYCPACSWAPDYRFVHNEPWPCPTIRALDAVEA